MPTETKILRVNENIVKIRRSLGLSQTQFASKLGTTKPIIGSYEENRAEVSLMVVHKLIRLKYVKKDELYSFIYLSSFRPTHGIRYKKVMKKIVTSQKTGHENRQN